MHSQPNPATAAGTAEDSFDEALLGLLIDDHPGLWRLAELSLAFHLLESGKRTRRRCPMFSRIAVSSDIRLFA